MVSDKSSGKASNSSERKRMPAVIDDRNPSELIRLIPDPDRCGFKVKAAMRDAGERLKTWTFNRVRDVWNNDPRIRITPEEVEELALAAAAAQAERRAAKLEQEDQEAKDEIRTICERLDAIERLLLAQDKEFNSAALESIRASADRLRRLDGGQG